MFYRHFPRKKGRKEGKKVRKQGRGNEKKVVLERGLGRLEVHKRKMSTFIWARVVGR